MYKHRDLRREWMYDDIDTSTSDTPNASSRVVIVPQGFFSAVPGVFGLSSSSSLRLFGPDLKKDLRKFESLCGTGIGSFVTVTSALEVVRRCMPSLGKKRQNDLALALYWNLRQSAINLPDDPDSYEILRSYFQNNENGLCVIDPSEYPTTVLGGNLDCLIATRNQKRTDDIYATGRLYGIFPRRKISGKVESETAFKIRQARDYGKPLKFAYPRDYDIDDDDIYFDSRKRELVGKLLRQVLNVNCSYLNDLRLHQNKSGKCDTNLLNQGADVDINCEVYQEMLKEKVFGLPGFHINRGNYNVAQPAYTSNSYTEPRPPPRLIDETFAPKVVPMDGLVKMVPVYFRQPTTTPTVPQVPQVQQVQQVPQVPQVAEVEVEIIPEYRRKSANYEDDSSDSEN